MSLDDYFQGRRDEYIQRKHVFTDRRDEQALLRARIETVTDRHLSIAELTNYRRPASNLTVVYGDGGIGKTALIRSATQELIEQNKERKAAAIYIDLGDFANHNFETVLIRLRGSLAAANKTWQAFDLAFMHYWAAKHPGVNLMRFIHHAGFLTTDQRKQVAQQLTSILDGVLGGMGLLSAGYRLVSALRSRLAESLVTRELMRTYPPFEHIINEPDPDDVLGYLPAVLAYDWERAREHDEVQAVCLLDTMEYIQDTRPERGSLEDLLARMVYLLPNMPFVAASRSRFNWSDESRSATLTFGGPRRWPELARTGSGQIQLNGLDDGSSEQLLISSLEVNGYPAIPAVARQRIARGSYGLPLYLELSINWYRDLLLSGNRPDPADLGKPFPELVLRIMRDLTPDERDLLRAASITETFNSELLSAIVPESRGSSIQRFLERSFVRYTSNSWLPYSIHESLSNAISAYDHSTLDHWTSDEWKNHAGFAAAWLEAAALQIWRDPSRNAVEQDEHGRRTVAAFLLIATVAVKYDLTPAQFGEVAFTVNQLGYRKAFASLPSSAAGSGSTPVQRLLTVAHALSGSLDNSLVIYEAIQRATVADPQDSCDRFVTTESARAAEEIGRYEEAADAFASLVAHGGEIGHYAALGKAGNTLRSGELATALTYAEEVSNTHPIHRAASLDLRGHIYLAGGEHHRAALCFEKSLQDAKSAGSPLWVARAMRHIAHARMWFDPDGVMAIFPEAVELNEALGETVGVAQCEMAKAMAHSWMGDMVKAERFLDLSQSHEVDPVAIGHPWMVETLLRKARGDDAGALAAAMRVLASSSGRTSRPHIWHAVTALWVDRNDLADFDAIEWYDTADSARVRWLRPLVDLRRTVRDPHHRDG